MAKMGLRNPAALATLAPSLIESTKGAADSLIRIQEKNLDFFQKNAKPIVLTAGAIALVLFGPGAYRKWRANNFAKNNIGNPEVTAAAIIYNSFTRFEPSGILGLVLPSFDIAADEAALFDIARRVSSLTEVAKAYDILFNRTLLTDIQNGLSTNELNTFLAIIQGNDGNPDIHRTILNGATVYNARKEVIAVKEAVQNNGIWSSTNNLYGNIQPNEKIGTVVSSHIYEPTGSTFYIVLESSFCVGSFCNYGLVWDNQIADKKL